MAVYNISMLKVTKKLKYISAVMLAFAIGLVVRDVSQAEYKSVDIVETAHADLASVPPPSGDGDGGGSGDS